MRKNIFSDNYSPCDEVDDRDVLCIECQEVMTFVGSWMNDVWECSEHGKITHKELIDHHFCPEE